MFLLCQLIDVWMKLLYDTELGDHKPIKLLHLMKKLMGTNRSHKLLKKLFLEELPKEVRKIIVSESDCDLNELTKADQVMAQYKITKCND